MVLGPLRLNSIAKQTTDDMITEQKNRNHRGHRPIIGFVVPNIEFRDQQGYLHSSSDAGTYGLSQPKPDPTCGLHWLDWALY